MKYILNFQKVDKNDVAIVGGKNASLGEMFQHLITKGIRIPDGYAVTSKAYWHFLTKNNIKGIINKMMADLDTDTFDNLPEIGEKIRAVILRSTIPYDLQVEIIAAYHSLRERVGSDTIQLAVRSSATAEDLPEASFAGQQESYLNIIGDDDLLDACLKCYASLFTNRAIKYRIDNGFDHNEVALSIGVQQMVRSDKACAGVGFTLEPESGFRDVIVLSGAWGLGENVVKGTIDPDEFIVFKTGLKNGWKSVISSKVGKKQETMIYGDSKSEKGVFTVNIPTPEDRQNQLVLSEKEVELLANWCLQIEEHYQMPMDIEWAKDGLDGQLYIVQARPETVHAQRDKNFLNLYQLPKRGKVLTSGIGLGSKIAAGKARILKSPTEAWKLQKGEVLVTETTDPDWDPILKKAAAVITNKGGRTSHAAIVARELGAVAIVGTGNATEKIVDGQIITVSCAEGKIGYAYEGKLDWTTQKIDLSKIQTPYTKPMLILGDPDKAFQYSFLPNEGIGLMRMEFIINNAIQIHPMALVKFDELEDEHAKIKINQLTNKFTDKTQYFVEELSEAVATIAAAFFPKPVIVRMSDFKSNEYANLIGGKQFEPVEANPMIGFRGAARYTHELYKEGFKLECEALKIVRNEMGLTNVKLMIPFCRTPEEGQKVINLMAEYGLERGENGLEIYTMIEVPSNVLLANDFAKVFDGFSIGSNDLTQLTLGIDRDNYLINDLFDENNPAVKTMIQNVVKAAKRHHIEIGLCGQAPSDFPEFAQFLVVTGIDTISFNQDALLQGIENIQLAEKTTSAPLKHNGKVVKTIKKDNKYLLQK